MTRLFVEQLTVLDNSYLCIERGLVGESWIVDVELEGELNEQGMVFDFGLVKKQLKSVIDELADHKLIVAKHMSGIMIERDTTLADHSAQINIQFTDASDNGWHYSSPESAVLLLESTSVSGDAVTAFLAEACASVLPSNVRGISLTLRIEQIDGAYYHYSHGLKKHEGNCQRIAHGHRSRIEIYVDDQRNFALERQWAQEFKDIYIGTEEDVVHQQFNIRDAADVNGDTASLQFSYHSPQGFFSLKVPRKRAYLIGNDSTVEWIATHIANKIKAQHPAKRICVRAFEGVKKGAISELD